MQGKFLAAVPMQSGLCSALPRQGRRRGGCVSGSHCPGEVTRIWALTENTTSLADTWTTVPNRVKRKRKSPNPMQYANDHIQLYENNCPGTAPHPRGVGQRADKPQSFWWPCVRWSSPRALDKRSSLPAGLAGTQGYQDQYFSTCSLKHSIFLLGPHSPLVLPPTD